ncbi:Fatty acid synthase [Halotydeus destructor]|nr:Fatty acid synthase [Halotydeus destructor]
MAAEVGQSSMLLQYMMEDVVVSGISGRFPESDNVDELADNLMNHVDMVTDDERRWPRGLYGLPPRAGKIKDLSKFDAQFFGVHGKQADVMDPQARMLLEVAYEAICDAGINPQTLRGSRTGVYIGVSVSEVEAALTKDTSVSGYALAGCTRSMFANRISFTFNFQGPSLTLDTACSSSFTALHQALVGLRTGQCDQAIVGGVNIGLRPISAYQSYVLNMLSPDGKCKHLDSSANGYVRSDTVAAIFMQKKPEAKRIYATLIHAKTNTDGYKKEGIMYPSKDVQSKLIHETYLESGVNPLDISYMEAHGTGTKAGDPQEINAIAEVLCNGRVGPLLVGSVKSNLGHTEPASGFCALAKVLISFERKCIPANLHFNEANPDIEPLIKGTIKPVVENTPYNGGLAGLNSFGFGGVNVHLIIKSNEKEQGPESRIAIGNVPRAVHMCGRTEEAVNHVFDFIEANPEKVTSEFLALVNDVSKTSSSSGMNYRGSMLMKCKEEASSEAFPRSIVREGEKRPLWLVFSGMGSQWPAMAKGLMHLDVFAKSIHDCANVLRPYDMDLLHMLISEDESTLDTTVAPFVAIAAVQIALIDILRALGIEGDGIVGHSVGELACAYADGCFTLEETIMSAYWRGKCTEDCKLPKGQMAAVGLTWEECKRRCPPGVFLACHNSDDSVTITGPYEITIKFMEKLHSEQVFVRALKTCEVAFHSQYVNPIAPTLLKRLTETIAVPKLRSSKWVSSSVPEEKWHTDASRYSAPAYYVNNLVSPVLFNEAMKHIPKDAIVMEIAPHTLMQAALKRSLGPNIEYVALMKRKNNDNAMDFLLQAIGKLYQLGLNPAIENLYPRVEYPVPKGTQSLSSLIKWDHSESWLVTKYPEYFNPNSSSDHVIAVDITSNEDDYLNDYCVDGQIVYPTAGYLMLAWKMFAKIKGRSYDEYTVEFRDVIFHRVTVLSNIDKTEFVVRITETSGEFSISEGGSAVVNGRVFLSDDVRQEEHVFEPSISAFGEVNLKMSAKDIYKEFRIRGYNHGPSFRLLNEVAEDGRSAKIKWTGNWVCFAESMLQVAMFNRETRNLFVPVHLQSVRCDPKILRMAVTETPEMRVDADSELNVVACKGLEIRGSEAKLVSRRDQKPRLEKHIFVPYNETAALSESDFRELREYLQVCATVAAQAARLAGKSSKAGEILGNFPQASEDLIQRYLIKPSFHCALLMALIELRKADAETFDKNCETIAAKHLKDLSSDALNNVFLRERFIRPSLDVVCENSGDQMKILELNSTSISISGPIIDYLSISDIRVAYTVAHANPSEMSGVSEGVDVVEWSRDMSPVELGTMDLVVYKDITTSAGGIGFKLETEVILETAAATVKGNGFILAIFRDQVTEAECVLLPSKISSVRVDEFISNARKLGLLAVARKSDSLTSSTILFRKEVEKSANTQAILQISGNNFEWVEATRATFVEYHSKPRGQNIWLVGQEAHTNGILGLSTCLRREPGGDRIRVIYNFEKPDTVRFEAAPYCQYLRMDLFQNIIQDGVFGSYRHIALEPVKEDVETEHAYLNVLTPGDLNTLKWTEAQHKHCSKGDTPGQLVHVYYAPLNLRDITLATGKPGPNSISGYTPVEDCEFGLEFSGRNEGGYGVMGMTHSKALATTVFLDECDFIWPIPDGWSMEEAATVPMAYSAAYYALIIRGSLLPGESVLVHLGYDVFITVDTKETQDALKLEYPELHDRNFAITDEISFERHVLRETRGLGVDFVLNASLEETLLASVNSLAKNGRLIKVGNHDLSAITALDKSASAKNIGFHGVNLESLFSGKANNTPGVFAQKQVVSRLIREGIKTGAVRPLKRTIFDKENVEEAFCHMGSSKYLDKVVIRIREEESKSSCQPDIMSIKAVARTALHPEKSYVIAGGLGGFGLELAHWLVGRGARNLVLSSRSGVTDNFQKVSIKRLESLGAKVLVSSTSAVTLEGSTKLIEEAITLGPVGGVFNLAVVLRDSLFESQSAENFKDVYAPKATATANLDRVTRIKCPELDHFVCFSSLTCGCGNAGQTTYGFANSVMERICDGRQSDGLPAMAIQWGIIDDVGIVAELTTVIKGFGRQRISSCLSVLDQLLHCPCAVSSSCVRRPTIAASSTSKMAGALDTITQILGIKDPSALSDGTTLSDLGLDSIMGVQVRQALESEYRVILSMTEARTLTIGQLKNMRVNQTQLPSNDAAVEVAAG